MHETRNALEHAGLTKIESKVYIALLKVGLSRAGKIAKEAQLNRTTTYDALKRLLDKGLASYVVQSNRKWFRPEDPKRFKELIKAQEEEVERVLPQLSNLFKDVESKKGVTLYYGLKGMKTVFEDILRNAKENYVMDSEGQFIHRMPYYAPHFIREVEKKKIKIKHIVRRGIDVHPTETTQVRFIPKKVGASQSVINIYGDKVAILVWTDPPEAVLIRNKQVAETFKHYFDIVWKTAKT